MSGAELYMLQEADGSLTPYIGVVNTEGREFQMPLIDFLVVASLHDASPDTFDRLVGLAGAILEEAGVEGIEA